MELLSDNMARHKREKVLEEVLAPEKVETEPVVEPTLVEEVKAVAPVRCPDCPWKAGLRDENTLCATCNGSGLVAPEVV